MNVKFPRIINDDFKRAKNPHLRNFEPYNFVSARTLPSSPPLCSGREAKREQLSVIIPHHDGTKLLCRGWNLWTRTSGWSCIIVTQLHCLNSQKKKKKKKKEEGGSGISNSSAATFPRKTPRQTERKCTINI